MTWQHLEMGAFEISDTTLYMKVCRLAYKDEQEATNK